MAVSTFLFGTRTLASRLFFGRLLFSSSFFILCRDAHRHGHKHAGTQEGKANKRVQHKNRKKEKRTDMAIETSCGSASDLTLDIISRRCCQRTKVLPPMFPEEMRATCMWVNKCGVLCSCACFEQQRQKDEGGGGGLVYLSLRSCSSLALMSSSRDSFSASTLRNWRFSFLFSVRCSSSSVSF